MMKNKIFFFLLITSAITNAQIGTRTLNSGSIFAGNANFDASAPFLANTGVLHSRTNLTTFAFAGADDQGYDGLVLYNTTAGNTPATGAGVGNQAVTKGFYYFDNAGGAGFGNPTTAGTWMPMGGGGVTDTPTFEPATEMDVNLSDPLVTPVISTETATSVFTFVNTRDRESGDKTTQIMNLPPPTPVGKLIIINNSANSLNVQFNPSVGGNNVVAAYRGVMLIATADGWLNLSE